jgi:hypothetical protein
MWRTTFRRTKRYSRRWKTIRFGTGAPIASLAEDLGSEASKLPKRKTDYPQVLRLCPRFGIPRTSSGPLPHLNPSSAGPRPRLLDQKGICLIPFRSLLWALRPPELRRLTGKVDKIPCHSIKLIYRQFGDSPEGGCGGRVR